MLSESFSNMPDDARVWVYAFDAQLSAEQEALICDSLDHFIAEWNSHGEPVEGRYHILERRFVIIAGYCTDGISGCSIDSKVKVFKELHDRFGLNALGGTRVFFRDAEGDIRTMDRSGFRRMVVSGNIRRDTPVFNLTARTLRDLRIMPIEQPYTDSWAAQVFGQAKQESAA